MGRPWLQGVQHPLALILRRGAHIVLLFLVAGENADFFDVCLEETVSHIQINLLPFMLCFLFAYRMDAFTKPPKIPLPSLNNQ